MHADNKTKDMERGTWNVKAKKAHHVPRSTFHSSPSVSICAPSVAQKHSSSRVRLPEKFQLLIDCRDEAEQRRLYEELAARHYACRVWVI